MKYILIIGIAISLLTLAIAGDTLTSSIDVTTDVKTVLEKNYESITQSEITKIDNACYITINFDDKAEKYVFDCSGMTDQEIVDAGKIKVENKINFEAERLIEKENNVTKPTEKIGTPSDIVLNVK